MNMEERMQVRELDVCAVTGRGGEEPKRASTGLSYCRPRERGVR